MSGRGGNRGKLLLHNHIRNSSTYNNRLNLQLQASQLGRTHARHTDTQLSRHLCHNHTNLQPRLLSMNRIVAMPFCRVCGRLLVQTNLRRYTRGLTRPSRVHLKHILLETCHLQVGTRHRMFHRCPRGHLIMWSAEATFLICTLPCNLISINRTDRTPLRRRHLTRSSIMTFPYVGSHKARMSHSRFTIRASRLRMHQHRIRSGIRFRCQPREH